LCCIALAAWGCGPQDSELCADAPVVTWNNFGDGFITESCQPCHASTAEARHGAPESVTFDDYDQVLEWEDRIMARVLDEDNPMPPQGGIDEDDRYKLEVWIGCWL
jgi:cytochrome c5